MLHFTFVGVDKWPSLTVAFKFKAPYAFKVTLKKAFLGTENRKWFKIVGSVDVGNAKLSVRDVA